MKAHVENFAGKSITTDDWKAFLFSFMENNYGAEKRAVLEKIDWEAWLHAPGLVWLYNHGNSISMMRLIVLNTCFTILTATRAK